MSITGELVTETFEYDGGRQVTVYVPPSAPEAVVFAGDGHLVPDFAPERFAAHEEFFVNDVRQWVRSRFAVALPAERSAVFGVSAGGELALALGLRHPNLYGAVFCASPGAGYRPSGLLPFPLPRAYFVAGTLEPFFHENAMRWAVALRDAGADVVMTERAGSHGDAFWREELPLMVAWAFGP